jgi:hypothetical protein
VTKTAYLLVFDIQETPENEAFFNEAILRMSKKIRGHRTWRIAHAEDTPEADQAMQNGEPVPVRLHKSGEIVRIVREDVVGMVGGRKEFLNDAGVPEHYGKTRTIIWMIDRGKLKQMSK